MTRTREENAEDLAHEEATAQGFTVWVAQCDGKGTHFVQTFKEDTVEDAKREALAECADCWDYDPDHLVILGVAEGKVTLIEWNEYEIQGD